MQRRPNISISFKVCPPQYYASIGATSAGLVQRQLITGRKHETSSSRVIELCDQHGKPVFFLKSYGLIIGIGTKLFACSIEIILVSNIAQTFLRNIGPILTASIGMYFAPVHSTQII